MAGLRRKQSLKQSVYAKMKTCLKNTLKAGKRRLLALFDQEDVFDTYVKSERKEAEIRTRKETVFQLLKAGRCSVDEIGELFPQLDEGDIIEIKQEFMQRV